MFDPFKGKPDENQLWNMSIAMSVLGGTSSSQGTLLTGLNTTPISITPPGCAQPMKTTASKITDAETRFGKRLQQVRGLLPVRKGRVIPGHDDLAIGEGRRLSLSVLFLDICGFSAIESGEGSDQDRVLTLLNLFMAEMLHVVREHGGEFEKNTGDGLMSYFGDGNESECTQRALDAAVTMHCYNDRVITPNLVSLGLPSINFRVGIETGLVTLANVGIHGGDHRSIVAIGTTANVACKLMNLIPDGGIVMGNKARFLLSPEWQRETSQIGSLPNFVLRGTITPYPAWEVKYRAPKQADFSAILRNLSGGY